MTAPVPRSWQLLMVGPGSRHVTPDLHDRLVRCGVGKRGAAGGETDAGGVSMSRNWPSNRMEEVAAIEADVAAMPGIARLPLLQAA